MLLRLLDEGIDETASVELVVGMDVGLLLRLMDEGIDETPSVILVVGKVQPTSNKPNKITEVIT